jgi:hypothetical protein
MVRAEALKKGKAGELLVAAELLSRGIDVFVPFVDCGMDLVASIEKRFVQIQVRKSKFYPNEGCYWQQIIRENFHKNKGADVYYVFVLKREEEVNFLIVPSMWIEENAEGFSTTKKKWFFYFELEHGRARETRKSKLDMTCFLNNWDLLKAPIKSMQ